jgi:ABC-type multidrug transport system fused ATPase/permease subunit
MLPSFDKVAVLKDGKIIEWGNPEELIASKGALHELIHGKTH